MKTQQKSKYNFVRYQILEKITKSYKNQFYEHRHEDPVDEWLKLD